VAGCGTLAGLAILRIFALKRIVVGATLVVVGLPVVLIVLVVVSFYALFYPRNRANGTIVSSGREREYGPMPAWLIGPSSRSIDASSLMWTFLRDHPLPRERGGGSS